MKWNRYIFGTVISLFLNSCGPKEIQPVELYPEDECASCRMAVSNPAFASEIINKDGSVVKFDDLRCFENYRKDHRVDEIEKMFVKNYETKEWIPFGKSIIIQTGIETPMGSGQVAVSDQQHAKQLTEKYPPKFTAMQEIECRNETND
jgi:copper chaperone NosL